MSIDGRDEPAIGELPEPRIGSSHDPSALIAMELAAIFIAPQFVVLPVRRYQFDTSLLERSAQWIRVVASSAMMRLAFNTRPPRGRGSRTSATVASAKINQSGRHFPAELPSEDYQVDQYHPLRPLLRLVLPTAEPSLAGAKLPSRKVSSHLSRPFAHPVSQQRAPCIQPDALLLPLLQSPPARGGR